MLKRKYTLILIVAIIMFCAFLVISISSRNCIISIKNDTNKTIPGLSIVYSNSFSPINVPEILEKQIYITELILPDNFVEGSIKILYSDNYRQKHEVYLKGYIEKGYKEKINVIITSVDDKGVLLIEVDIQKGFFWFF